MVTKKKKIKNPHATALGKLVFKKYGPEYFQKLGRVGGSRGGKSTLDRHGPEFFSSIGKIGGASKRKRKYPKCPRYRSHRFTLGGLHCPCGFTRKPPM